MAEINIIPGVGFGDLRFDVTLDEVLIMHGNPLWEPWMGGAMMANCSTTGSRSIGPRESSDSL